MRPGRDFIGRKHLTVKRQRVFLGLETFAQSLIRLHFVPGGARLGLNLLIRRKVLAKLFRKPGPLLRVDAEKPPYTLVIHRLRSAAKAFVRAPARADELQNK